MSDCVCPVDIDGVMEQVRQRVAQKRAAGIYPPLESGHFPEIPVPAASAGGAGDADLLATLGWRVEGMHQAARLNLKGEPVRSHRPVIGTILKKWKNFTRFWIRRYTDTLFLQQSRYNVESAQVASALLQEVARLRAEVDALKEQSEK